MRKIVALLLTVAMTVMSVGFCLAEDSLQAKAAKIRTGRDGDTEAQVKALMGEPRTIETEEKMAGINRIIKRRLLIYGAPGKEIIVVIDGDEGYVRAVK
jgi:hypothetical protein